MTRLRCSNLPTSSICVAAFFFLFVLLGLPQPAFAASWKHEALNRASELLKENCGQAWNIVWPLAKSGNEEAQYFIFSWLFNTPKLRLPGDVFDSRESPQYRTLSVYAAAATTEFNEMMLAANSNWRRNFAKYIVATVPGAGGQSVAQCYENNKSGKECQQLAVSLGVVPSFKEFATNLDQTFRETGTRARCMFPHGEMVD
jgi:hypothetical protein